MTISAENVFGPKARSTRTGASHVVRVDRGATRECAEVRETQSRRVRSFADTAAPCCKWGCCGPRLAQLTRSQRPQHRRPTTGHAQMPNVGSPGPPLAGKAPRASPQGVSPNLPNCQISLDQRDFVGRTPSGTRLDNPWQYSCGPNSLPPARTTQSSLELS